MVTIATIAWVGSMLGAIAADALAVDFVDEAVITGLVNPTNVEFATDGRVFIAEKRGTVKVYDSVTDTTPTQLIDLSASVHDFWDRGLLGLAIHPQFLTGQPYVYVLYTYDDPADGTWNDACPSPPGATNDGCMVTGRLSRLQVNPSNNSLVGGEQVLITDWCQQYPSHSIGDLEFGADGFLYASGGDGASFSWVDYGQGGGDSGSPTPLNPCGDPPVPIGGTQTTPTAEGGALRSQDLRTSGDPVTLDGTIIRIDPATGLAAPGNPLISSSDLNTRRVVADGLRNPFRIAFRPGTNDLYIGDVGWSTWEEVNRHSSPTNSLRNFGWPCYEGGSGISLPQGGYDGANLDICEDLYSTGPVHAAHFAYRHNQDISGSDPCPPANPPQGTSSSIAGLAFYPGGQYPGSYVGALFGADYSRDCIWVMYPGTGGIPDPSTVAVFQHQAQNPVDLEAGPNGDIYYVNLNLGGSGQLRRLRFVGGNTPPNAVIDATPTSGPLPFTVDFDASGSSDPDGDGLSYAWDLDDDGQYDDGTSPVAQRTFTTPGNHRVRLLVTDARSESDTDDVTISAANLPPTPVIDTPSPSFTWRVGETIDFSGHATDPDQGNLPPSALSWQLILHHCETDGSCHQHLILTKNGASGSIPGEDHEYPSWFELILTATDQFGSSASTSRALQPETVDLDFETAPGGLVLNIGGKDETAPSTHTAIIGASVPVSASSPQQMPINTWWEFVSWSDGGTRAHTVIAPSTPTTYTATYNARPDITSSPAVSVPENQTAVLDVNAVDDADGEGAGLTYAKVGGTDQARFGLSASSGVLTFSSPPDFESPTDHNANNVYQVQVRVTDSGGLSDTQTITVTVTNVNEPPDADPDSYSVAEETTLAVGSASGVLANDTDPEGGITAALLVDVTNGALSLSANGSFTYTPDPNWTGVETFTYRACDSASLCDQASVDITVDPVNDPPSITSANTANVAEGQTFAIDVQSNDDDDGEGSGLVFSLSGGADHARFGVNAATGVLTFSAPPDFETPADHNGDNVYQVIVRVTDSGGLSTTLTINITVTDVDEQGLGDDTGHSVGVVDVMTGRWYLRDPDNGATTSFLYGNAGDVPFVGDWDCDGDETPGLYRQSDGFVYLRNSNSQGIADIRFFFGNAGDIPVAGDFDGDGCDTVSLYRPGEARFYIVNRLGVNGGGLGVADHSFLFGNFGDKPFVGDFDDDDIDEIGLHRESTGLVYFRYTLDEGVADESFLFGDAGDRLMAGRWADLGVPGPHTVGLLRPSNGVLYLRFSNTQGVADVSFPYGSSKMLPVAGHFGDLPGGGPHPS